MTRDEIINVFLVRASSADREKIAEMLYSMSKEELDDAYQVLQVQAKNEELTRVRLEREANRLWHQHEMQQARKPQREAEEKLQLERDRNTFREAALKYGLSEIESNFNVVRAILGPAFDGYQVGQILISNAASLVPASQSELEERAREAEEARVDFLTNHASPAQLRDAAEQETRHRRIRFHRAEKERQIAERAKIDATQGYAPLPETTSDGTKIDAHFLKNLKTEIYRNYLRHYGASAITARLNRIQ